MGENDFISNSSQAAVVGASTGNGFRLNYWDNWHTRSQGCVNTAPFDQVCDTYYNFTGGQDQQPLVLRSMDARDDWTWYDNIGGDDWVLLGDRPTSPGDSPFGFKFSLNIGGAPKTLGSSLPSGGPGFVQPGALSIASSPG